MELCLTGCALPAHQMESLAVGSVVLLVADCDKTAKTVGDALSRRGFVVKTRFSGQTRAVVCAPCRAALPMAGARRVEKYEGKGLRVVDVVGAGTGDSSTPMVSKRPSNKRWATFQRENHACCARVAEGKLLPPSETPYPPACLSNDSGATLSKSSGEGCVSEKRLARWRSRPSSATSDRIGRAFEQRMYLIKQECVLSRAGTGPARSFTVLGSTGNVYTVTIDAMADCTCPDAAKGNVCKHVLFVMLRVLRVDPSSPLIYQQALLSHERTEVFALAPHPVADSLACASVQRAYAAAVDSSKVAPGALEHRGSAEDSCSICFEAFGKEQLQICQSCSNAVHEECFVRWTRVRGGVRTCPLCRATVAPLGNSQNKRIGSEGYLNFSAEAGLPLERDTSSYRHWPPREE